LGFDTQSLSKEIYKYLTGNYSQETNDWFNDYGHLLLGFNKINKICRYTQITYKQNKKITKKIKYYK